MDKKSELALIHQSIRSCTACPRYTTRLQAVPGYGSPDAPAMMIGQTPGKDEDNAGVPLVGKAGEIFNTILEKVGIPRRSFFITNVLKCYAPMKRLPPDMQQLSSCRIWLDEQMETVDPDIVVLAGAFAINEWFPGEKISYIHGKPRCMARPWNLTGRPLLAVPVYNPAAVIDRGDGGGVDMRLAEEDFRVVADLIWSLDKREVAVG